MLSLFPYYSHYYFLFLLGVAFLEYRNINYLKGYRIKLKKNQCKVPKVTDSELSA